MVFRKNEVPLTSISNSEETIDFKGVNKKNTTIFVNEQNRMHSLLKKKFIPLYLFAFAFIVRMLYLLEIHSITYFKHPIMDALYHYNWAKEIAQGEWIGKEVFFRAPLYPYFLGVIYFITGNHFFLPRIIQFIIGAFSSVLIYQIVLDIRKCWKTALIAGLIGATYWVTIYFEGELLLDSLGSFFNLCMLSCLIKIKNEKKHLYRSWFMSGLFFGLSAITRPNILFFFPVLIWWLYYNNEYKIDKHSIRKGFILLFGAALCIAPVTIRNAVIGRDFVLISSQGGLNFYLGNNPKSNGWTAIAPGMRGTWKEGIEDARMIAEMKKGRKLKPSEVSQYWFDQGFTFFKQQPVPAMGLFLKKCALLIGKHEIKNNEDPNFIRGMSNTLKLLPLHYGILLPFAVGGFIGLLLFRRLGSEDVLLSTYFILYCFSIVLFFVCARYRVPILPILMMYSASAVMLLVDCFKRKTYKKLTIIASGISLFLLLSNIDFFHLKKMGFAQSHFNLGMNYYNEGKIDLAEKNLKKAIELDSLEVYAYTNLATIYAQRKEYKKSLTLYLKALTIDPNSLLTYENIASLYAQNGEIQLAVPVLQELMKRIPAHRVKYKKEIQQWHDMLCVALLSEE